jgi:hypothetical protein
MIPFFGEFYSFTRIGILAPEHIGPDSEPFKIFTIQWGIRLPSLGRIVLDASL